MFDLARITGFDWDAGNSAKSVDRHSVAQGEAEQVFADDLLLMADDVKHSHSEPRYHALGRTMEGRMLHVTFTLRDHDTRIRVISARDMNRRERGLYESQA